MPKLTVIVPCYNEERTVAETLRKLDRVRVPGWDVEIIVVDDGSADGTAAAVEALRAGLPSVTFLAHGRNLGKGAAVRTALKAATGDAVLIQDADAEYDPADIPALVREYAARGGAVYGSRNLGKNKGSSPLFYLGGLGVTAVTDALYGLRLTDMPTGYKLVARRDLERMELRSRRFEFCAEVTAKLARLGVPIREVPIRYAPRSRRDGKKIRVRDGIFAVAVLCRYRFWSPSRGDDGPGRAVWVRRPLEAFLIAALFVTGLASLMALTQDFRFGDRQYAWLADSFLHGRMDIDANYLVPATAIDTTVRNGLHYWPLGPLPAVLLVPFVAVFGPEGQSQATLQVMAVLLAWLGAYALARRSGFAAADAGWLVAAFAFGSVFVGVSMFPLPWYLANVIAVLVTLAALVEARGKDRPAVIGAFVGLAAASRITAGAFGAVFFLVREIVASRPVRDRVVRIARFAAPALLALLLLGWYNAARFGSPFDSGYRDSLLNPGGLADDRERYGLFDFAYVGRNLYLYFLAPPRIVDGLPVPDKHGYSVLLMAPAFLWILAANRRTRDVLPTLAATAAAFAVLLPYYSDGASEFGPRYLNDILPFWFALLLSVFAQRGFRRWPKAVIALSAAANLALVGLYAVFNLFNPS
ncbi:MAG TPA: glycosyltransferase family 2 protein [Patescibacteria group bacterium]|nr:glycosyltransferase family 2 protein [Patescibacteria group bacterium]